MEGDRDDGRGLGADSEWIGRRIGSATLFPELLNTGGEFLSIVKGMALVHPRGSDHYKS